MNINVWTTVDHNRFFSNQKNSTFRAVCFFPDHSWLKCVPKKGNHFIIKLNVKFLNKKYAFPCWYHPFLIFNTQMYFVYSLWWHCIDNFVLNTQPRKKTTEPLFIKNLRWYSVFDILANERHFSKRKKNELG